MLVADHITKRFPGVTALENVCLELYPGKVNAVIGENGAGKSTLMKILSGVYADYEGKIIFNNETVHFQNTRHAQACGIEIIHQELSLVPHMSITENIYLGREIVGRLGLLDKQTMRENTISLLQRLKIQLDPDDKISSLKVGQQQVVEIAKSLLFDARVIIMDEPTSAISEEEVMVLFEIIDGLRKEQKIIVYISHKLDELFKIADRYVVLRDGKSIESGDMKKISQEGLINKMVGREIVKASKAGKITSTLPVLSVKNLSLKNPDKENDYLFKEITFLVAKGEILGIFGLMGAGRTELLETLFGLHYSQASGDIVVDNEQVSPRSPIEAIAAGLALVPEDRKKEGLVLALDVRKNISLTILKDLQKYGVVNERLESLLADRYIKELAIKTPSDKQRVNNLSGGNQQKIVIAKWLATRPKLLMLDEPTRGIDVNAKNEIYKIIIELATRGTSIIMVSSELPEILSVSDRVLVMCEGQITKIIATDEATEDIILKAAIPK